ncbi:MAG: flagellar hook protein FlgE [Sulfurimonas sp.]|jgi:flagellar hook protein FlgE|uniref:flagellar hook-basal body complex protein n=1 Tax=Sulfurimonas sp. TaxID=2022749 RepID=UPI0039E665DC
MLTQAFYTGLAGVRSNQFAIDVTSDNLANISTTGFRGSEYEFASLFEDAINTSHSLNSSTVGIGSRIQATALKEAQGSLELTDRSTDLAILGNGWFGTQGANDPIYTRDGAFTFDANSDLVSQDGAYVLGTIGGNISDDDTLTEIIDEVPLGNVGTQEKLRFPSTLTYPPVASTTASFIGNIGTTDDLRTMSAGVIDPENNRNNLELIFTKATNQVPPGIQWDVIAKTKSLDEQTTYDTQEGFVEFDSQGSLLSSTFTTIDNNGVDVTIDLGTGFNGVLSNNTAISASSSANGTIGGDLVGYSINKNADVLATFSNGFQSSVGKIAVYHFQNDQGLERINGSKFQESSNSGRPLFYKDSDNQNIIGVDIANFKLEGSNIDMTYGITELIILQRSFDANSKSITTADQMMQKALNMDA